MTENTTIESTPDTVALDPATEEGHTPDVDVSHDLGAAAADDPGDDGSVITGDEEDAAQAGQDAAESDQPPAGDPRLAKVRREAQNLRGRLTTAETERDQVRGQLEQMRRATVVELAARAGLATGDDLFLDDQVQLDDLVAVDGTVDEAAVTDTVRGVLERHPHWQRLQRFGSGAGLRPKMRDHLDQQVGESDQDYEVRRHAERLKMVNRDVHEPDFNQGWAAALKG